MHVFFGLMVGLGALLPGTEVVAGPGHSDLDGNGKDDIVWRNTVTGDVAGWLMDGLDLDSFGIITASTP